jgi:hypothetical protein
MPINTANDATTKAPINMPINMANDMPINTANDMPINTANDMPINTANDSATTAIPTTDLALINNRMPSPIPSPSHTSGAKSLTFSNIDEAQHTDNTVVNISAPKDIITLENISDKNHAQRLLDEGDDNDDEDKIHISSENEHIQLDIQTL